MRTGVYFIVVSTVQTNYHNISIPKGYTLHLKLLNIVASEIVCLDGHLDTLNSKVRQLRKI